MFKVLEVHSGYISSAIAIIIHILAAFYFLYILKTSYEGYIPGNAEKKVVWYKAPTVTPQPTQLPPSYQEPEKALPMAAAAVEPTPVATPEIAVPQEQPIQVNPLRKGRSAQERRAAWSKPAALAPEQEPKKLTAGALMDAISQEQALKRQAHAVYTKQEAIKQGIAAQMREITEGRLRHKVFSAMQMAFDQHKKEYFSPVPIMSNINLAIVLDQKGEIVAIEVLQSTGTPSLDEHIIKIIQTIKKIALPPSTRGQEFRTVTFPAKVTIHAGSGHIIFDYKDASGMHIV